MTLKLNPDQQSLVKDLVEFYESPRKFFLLSGQAGVGKTTTLRVFIGEMRKRGHNVKICMSAPTNKATKVLRETIMDCDVEFKTTYSLLGLRMMPNGQYKELTDSGKDSVGNYDILAIDEASMLSTELLDYVLKKTALADTKVVMIGDRQQLPPVNEEHSPIWTQFKTDYELTQVMRHQNAILSFVQSIRGKKNPSFVSPGEPVFMHEEETFIQKINEAAKNGEFHNGSAKAIAWRNVTVDWLNEHIRSQNPITNHPDKFVKGDRVIFREPLIESDVMLAATDDEGEIISSNITHHILYPNLKTWTLDIKMENGESIVARVIHTDSKDDLKNMLDDLSKKKQWSSFWKLKEAFHDIAYAYALTAHRSQGSTFPKTFVDAGDIMQNHDGGVRSKCLYVACSRASKELHIFP